MARFKYMSSTERHQIDNLESLKEKVKKYHPLSGIYYFLN